MQTSPHDPSVSPLLNPDWRAAITLHLIALVLESVGLGSVPRRRLRLLTHEYQGLIVLAASFETQGNVTHTAARLGTSRRMVREHLAAWHDRHPSLVPRVPANETSSRASPRRKRKGETQPSPEDASR